MSSKRAAVLKPVTARRAAGLKPLTAGRAAGLAPVTSGRAAGLKPVTAGRAAAPKPVTIDRAATLDPVSLDRAAAMKAVTEGRVAGLAPVTSGRVAGLTEIATGNLANVTLGRPGLMPVTAGRGAVLPNVVLKGSETPVIAWQDGYLLPYEARDLVKYGWLNREGLADLHTARGYETYSRTLTRTFHRNGWGRTRLIVGPGSGYYGLNRFDSCGPQWYHRSYYNGRFDGRYAGRSRGLTGRRVGDFYFPLAFYLRPYGLRWGAGRYNKTYWPILVPWDCAEGIPEDFERTLRKSHFPMVIGDMAFKDGKYVQAALAFRDALDRKAELVAGRFAFGDTLIALRNYQYAVKSIRGGLQAAPKWADKLDRNGVYGVKGHLAKHLKEVEQFTVDYTKTQAGFFLLGYLRMTSGDAGLREKAIPAFEKAVALGPDDQYSRRFLDLLRGEAQEIDLKIAEPVEAVPELAKAKSK